MVWPNPSCAAPLPPPWVTLVWGWQGAHLVCQEAQLVQEVLAQPQLVPHRVPLHLCPQGLGLLPHALLPGSGV